MTLHLAVPRGQLHGWRHVASRRTYAVGTPAVTQGSAPFDGPSSAPLSAEGTQEEET
jgi:hypothetical protein